MHIYENSLYLEDVSYVAHLDLPWNKLRNRSVLVSGATGQIGSFLVDVLLDKNRDGLGCTIYALGRDENKAIERFGCNSPGFSFIHYDINEPLVRDDIGRVDYVIHLASNTHPIAYSTDPIGTITTNIIGTRNMLDFAIDHMATRCAFASSNEIYGENRGDVETFDEKYCGYIDSNTLRAGYPESKRCGEALCQAYIRQKGLDIVIPRFTRCYGPTILKTDTKAITQFIRNGINGENIVLKSSGEQFYSFLYVADSVSGLLTTLLQGENGEAYNISDIKSDISLRDLASLIAQISDKSVVFDIPDETEAAGYSRATKARLDSKKLQSLGWKAEYDITKGLERTIDILKSINP